MRDKSTLSSPAATATVPAPQRGIASDSDLVELDPGGPAVTETNRSTLLELPSAWLDRLIVLSATMPVNEGREAAMRFVVQAVAAILPDYSVGARMAPEDGGRRVYSEPPKSHEQTRSERLFPEAQHERAIALPTGAGWLHVASDGALDDDRAAPILLMERAAFIASEGLDRVKSFEEAARL